MYMKLPIWLNPLHSSHSVVCKLIFCFQGWKESIVSGQGPNINIWICSDDDYKQGWWVCLSCVLSWFLCCHSPAVNTLWIISSYHCVNIRRTKRSIATVMVFLVDTRPLIFWLVWRWSHLSCKTVRMAKWWCYWIFYTFYVKVDFNVLCRPLRT